MLKTFNFRDECGKIVLTKTYQYERGKDICNKIFKTNNFLHCLEILVYILYCNIDILFSSQHTVLCALLFQLILNLLKFLPFLFLDNFFKAIC